MTVFETVLGQIGVKFLWLNTFGLDMIELFVLEPHKFGDNKETSAIIVRNYAVVKYGYWNSLLTSTLKH